MAMSFTKNEFLALNHVYEHPLPSLSQIWVTLYAVVLDVDTSIPWG